MLCAMLETELNHECNTHLLPDNHCIVQRRSSPAGVRREFLQFDNMMWIDSVTELGTSASLGSVERTDLVEISASGEFPVAVVYCLQLLW